MSIKITFSHVIKPQDPDKQAALIKEDGLLLAKIVAENHDLFANLKSLTPDQKINRPSPSSVIYEALDLHLVPLLDCPTDEIGLIGETSVPCSDREVSLTSLIVHLNDDHKWTREMIADWLESLDVDLSFKLVD